MNFILKASLAALRSALCVQVAGMTSRMHVTERSDEGQVYTISQGSGNKLRADRYTSPLIIFLQQNTHFKVKPLPCWYQYFGGSRTREESKQSKLMSGLPSHLTVIPVFVVLL